MSSSEMSSPPRSSIILPSDTSTFCTSRSQDTLDPDDPLPYSDGMRGRSVKESEEQLTTLKKENFNLKLRIYFLEERMGKNFNMDQEHAVKKNIELMVKLESLTNELQGKQELLCQAVKALEVEEGEHRKDCETKEKEFNQVKRQYEVLQQQFEVVQDEMRVQTEKEDKLDTLMMELNEKNKALLESNNKLLSVELELIHKKSELCFIETELKKNEKSKVAIAHRNSKIMDLESTVDKYRTKMGNLELKTAQNEVKSKLHDLSSSELLLQYKKLTVELDTQEQILRDTLKEKDAQMTSLQQKYDDLLKEVQTRNKRILDLEDELMNSKKVNVSKEKSDCGSSFWIKESEYKDKVIERLEKELSKRTCNLQSANKELREKNHEIEKLQENNRLEAKNIKIVETHEICCVLSKRFEVLTVFLNSLLQHNSDLGLLNPKYNSKIRNFIDQTLNFSKSLNLSISINSDESLSNITELLNTTFEDDFKLEDCLLPESESTVLERLKTIQKAYEEVESKFREFEKKYQEECKKTEYAINERDHLLGKVTDVEATVNMLEIQKRKADKKVIELQNRITQMEEALIAAETKKCVTEKKIFELENHIETLQGSKQSLLESIDSNTKSIQNKMKEIEYEKNQAIQAAKTLEVQLKEAKNQVNYSTEKHETTEKEMVQIKKSLEEAEKDFANKIKAVQKNAEHQLLKSNTLLEEKVAQLAKGKQRMREVKRNFSEEKHSVVEMLREGRAKMFPG